MSDPAAGIGYALVVCALGAVVAFAIWQDRHTATPVAAEAPPKPVFLWRWCPDDHVKILTADFLRPCPVCAKALEVRQ